MFLIRSSEFETDTSFNIKRKKDNYYLFLLLHYFANLEIASKLIFDEKNCFLKNLNEKDEIFLVHDNKDFC